MDVLSKGVDHLARELSNDGDSSFNLSKLAELRMEITEVSIRTLMSMKQPNINKTRSANEQVKRP